MDNWQRTIKYSSSHSSIAKSPRRLAPCPLERALLEFLQPPMAEAQLKDEQQDTDTEKRSHIKQKSTEKGAFFVCRLKIDTRT